MTKLLYRLGRWCVRHRRRVLIVWIAFAVLAVGIGKAAGGTSSNKFSVPGVESQKALDVLQQKFPSAAGTSAQVVFAARTGTLTDTTSKPVVDAALKTLAAQANVESVSALHTSTSGTIGFADVSYSKPLADVKTSGYDDLKTVAASSKGTSVDIELGGEVPTAAEQVPPSGQEAFGLVAAIIVLLLAFGSVIAMGLPIGTALLGLTTSIGLITIVSAVADINSIATVLASMIGLGVGIDYSLFIVTRHRENLKAGMTVEESAGRSIATSGSAVLFAGVTVVIAICGLAIAGIPNVTWMGLMSGMTVLVMVAISLTLLPALLGFAGHRIDRVGLPGMRKRAARKAAAAAALPAKESGWHRWGRQVSSHPVRYLIGGVAILAVLASPIFSLRLGSTDNGTASKDLSIRRSYDLLSEGFGAGFNGPLLLTVELDKGTTVDSLTPLTAAISADTDVQAVSAVRANTDASAAVIQVTPKSSPQASATTDLVHRLRDSIIPTATAANPGAHVYVGGETAVNIDLSDKISTRLPYFMGAVILLSILLLMMVFRSVAVPIKAAVMNLLSIGAAYGVIVAIFQWGWLKGLVGLHETTPIVSFLPMMMFAILFGLSMDYEVFLLSRVREEYLHHHDSTASVIEGISATARVITSAALIMICVFASFILGDEPTIKMFGLGLSVAVFVDATIVRTVLVPATMKLLGDWNWWLPGWLDRLLPNLDIEGGIGLPEPEYEAGHGGDVIDIDDEFQPAMA
ncbi:MAG TPA: MMPL family transporter [Ilumatobacteraceae bacterium]